MSFKSIINHYRRTIMKALTGNIGKGVLIKKGKIDSNLNINRVLICRPNQRLGNTLLITPLVQEIIKENPNVVIDIFVKGRVAPIIFQNYPQVDQIIELPKKPFKELINYINVWFKIRNKKYDLAINVHQESSSGRISTIVSKSKYKLFGDEFLKDDLSSEQIHLAKIPVYQFRQFLETVKGKKDDSDYPIMNLNLSQKEIEDGKNKLNAIIENPSKKTLAFFTYATGDKCYVANWWTNFYNDFYSKYSTEYNLVEILPVEDISMLDRKLPTFYSKDVREIAAFMNNCELLVAADSGMMHLGVAAPTKTIGLFKSGHFNKYKPYGKGNTMVLVEDNNHLPVIEALDNILK